MPIGQLDLSFSMHELSISKNEMASSWKVEGCHSNYPDIYHLGTAINPNLGNLYSSANKF